MSSKSEVLRLLNERNGQCISGQEMADTLGISRNAVWKAIKTLQSQGFNIESIAASGYRLKQEADIVSKALLEDLIKTPCKVYTLDKVDSTNNYAKTIYDLSKPLVIVAEEQTAGRGRLGRSFYSPSGKGIYMSLVFEPTFGLEQSMLVTTLTAVSVCSAIESLTGLKLKIKWVNDIYLADKKLAGILTEAETNFESGKIQKIIVGIGINCFEDELMPDDIKEIATHIKDAKEEFSRTEIIAAITNDFFRRIENFNQREIIREYKSRSNVLGEQILIFNPAIAREIGRPKERFNEGIRARAIDIDGNGGLVVEYLEGRMSRQMATLTTGEITIRKAY